MEEDMIIISARLKAIRKEQRLTQKTFADKFGISQSSYSGYESGTIAPTLFFLIQVAKEYNISMDYLTGISKEKKGLQADEENELIREVTFGQVIKQCGGDETRALEMLYNNTANQLKECMSQLDMIKTELDRRKNTSDK